MRAGKLDREITIEKYVAGAPDQYGTVQPSWQCFATVRAQIVQQSTEEFMRSFGTSDEAAVIFRIRWMEGIGLADRVVYEGHAYNLKEIKEIGRRNGLELRAIATS
jgi:phage head-tail adaptor, putative, SPP1 family